jgi:D-arabinose 1-dehydrogenase-like Zn-dependent alcohol dehydrogenase
LENAFLTNNGDSKNIEEAKTAMKEFKETRTSAMISLASAGWNGLGYIKIFSLSQLSAKTFALTQMKATNKIFNTLAETKVATKLKSAMDAMGETAMIKIDTVTYQLAKVGEATRTKILELLKDSRFTPKDLKEMFDEAYQTAKNCT